MKTAIRQMIEKLESRISIEGDGSEYFEALSDVIKEAESLEPVNEQQIKDAVKWRANPDLSEQYFNETYKP